MEYLNVDWFYYLIIALSLIELVFLIVITARWKPYQEVKRSKATRPFFVPEDGRNIK